MLTFDWIAISVAVVGLAFVAVVMADELSDREHAKWRLAFRSVAVRMSFRLVATLASVAFGLELLRGLLAAGSAIGIKGNYFGDLLIGAIWFLVAAPLITGCVLIGLIAVESRIEGQEREQFGRPLDFRWPRNSLEQDRDRVSSPARSGEPRALNAPRGASGSKPPGRDGSSLKR
jgi:hypothetical protein